MGAKMPFPALTHHSLVTTVAATCPKATFSWMSNLALSAA